MREGQGKYKSRLSRSYRFKKKIGKAKQINNDSEKYEIKKPRIVIRNLSFKTTESDVRRLYEPFGEIEEINLLKHPDGKLVGCGFVQFTNLQDASKAIFKTNKLNFLGRNISCEWAIPKSQFCEKIKEENKNIEEDKSKIDNEEINVEKSENDNFEIKKRKDSFIKKNTVSKTDQRKLQKLKKRKKRSRIVIRNLPFNVTEEMIKEHFIKYGNVEEIMILKKSNGLPTGCCFLQFDRVHSAAQAIHYENLKPFQNRLIVVDWAVPKDKFQESNRISANASEDNKSNETITVKDENDQSFNENEIEVKEEKDSDEEEIKEENESDENNDTDEDENDSDNETNYDEHDDNETDNDDKKDIKLELDNESSSQPRRISNDVSEGKTVFIKNVPFSAKNEDIKQCMEQFGPVYYALICIDPLTEHSKGTAFVKFRNIEDAEKCLAAGTELKIHNQVLDPHKALAKNEVNEKNTEKKKQIKDSRNLYLVKEGVILASSSAAQDVSASDMARRLQLEQWKSQMLRNLNMFVSRVRLVIHNLPTNVDDSKLRQLFKNHSKPNAIITEARVMRDLKNVDANGIGTSKEYGFVSFTNHEDALKALRSINNNPNIFSKARRPIVAFSIENRIMVNAKQKRVEKSRQHNPLWKRKREEEEEQKKQETNNNKADKSKKHKNKRRKSETTESKAIDNEVESFAGTTCKPGVNRMNGKFFLKKQAAIHGENLKQQKKKVKSLKRLTEQKKEFVSNRKEAKPKQGAVKQDADEVNFNRLVSNYKNKLSSISNLKSKWYET